MMIDRRTAEIEPTTNEFSAGLDLRNVRLTLPNVSGHEADSALTVAEALLYGSRTPFAPPSAPRESSHTLT